MNKAQFMQQYRKLTPNQRVRTIITIDMKNNKNLFNTPFSWNDAYREIYKGSMIGKKILEKLK